MYVCIYIYMYHRRGTYLPEIFRELGTYIYIYVIKSKNQRLYFFIIRVDRFNTFEKQIQIHIYS